MKIGKILMYLLGAYIVYKLYCYFTGSKDAFSFTNLFSTSNTGNTGTTTGKTTSNGIVYSGSGMYADMV